MNRKSRYNIKIDFQKSFGSYIHDKNTENKYLDFFGQYATLSLGYNHPIFTSGEYIEKIKLISHQKIVNNEIASDEAQEFDELFRSFSSFNNFHFFHYSCTGALAVEAAIKTAIDYKKIENPKIISFKGSFHGINGYGGIVTDRFNPVNERLDGFPGSYWDKFDNPTVINSSRKSTKNSDIEEEKIFKKIEYEILNKKNICAILVEPIQCTNGDLYFTDNFFSGLREIASEHDIPLIFDEIQTGFCSTGHVWYYQSLPIIPDILIFGKKTQLSGIMVNKKFSSIFDRPIRLEVTWDADLIDMVRCKYVIKAINENNLIQNAIDRSNQLISGLKNITKIKNLRHAGLLVGFDMENNKLRDKLVSDLFKKYLIVNPTKEKSIRLRPPLTVSSEEINSAIKIFTDCLS